LPEDRGAGNEGLGAGAASFDNGRGVDPAVDLEANGTPAGVDPVPELGDLGKNVREEALAGKPRVDGHDEHDVERIPLVTEDLETIGGVEGHPRTAAERADPRERPVKMPRARGVHDERPGSHAREFLDEGVGRIDHEVDVELGPAAPAAERVEHERAHGEVGHVVVVHHVVMDHVGPGGEHGVDLGAEAREVGGDQRGGEKSGTRHGGGGGTRPETAVTLARRSRPLPACGAHLLVGRADPLRALVGHAHGQVARAGGGEFVGMMTSEETAVGQRDIGVARVRTDTEGRVGFGERGTAGRSVLRPRAAGAEPFGRPSPFFLEKNTRVESLELEGMESELLEKGREFGAERYRAAKKNVLAERELREETRAESVTGRRALQALGPRGGVGGDGFAPFAPGCEVAFDLVGRDPVRSQDGGEGFGRPPRLRARSPGVVAQKPKRILPESLVAETPAATERTETVEETNEKISESDRTRCAVVIAQEEHEDKKKPEHGRGRTRGTRPGRRPVTPPLYYRNRLPSLRAHLPMSVLRPLLLPSLVVLAGLVFVGTARAQPDLYVPDTANSTLLVVDAASGTLVQTVALPGPPTAVAVATASGTVYVGLSVTTSSNTTIEVVPYDPANGTLGSPIALATTTLANTVEALAVNPAGTALYASSESDTLYAVDLESGSVSQTINLGGYGTATDLALSPNGHTLYFALPNATAVGLYDPETGGFGLLSLGSDAPLDLALNPSGSRLYVSEPLTNQIAVLDTDTGALLTQWTVPSYPEGLAVSPDGTTVYVASAGSNLVAAFDAENGTETATVALPAAPSDLALTPDGTGLYALLGSEGALASLPAPGLAFSSILDLTSGTLEATGDLMGAGDIAVTNQSLPTTEGTGISGTLSAQDSLGRALSFSLLTPPSHGTASVSPSGSFSYTPASGYIGIDRFTFLASASGGPGEPADPVSAPGVVRVCAEPTTLTLTAPEAVTIAAATGANSGPSTIAFTTNAPCGASYTVTSSNTTLFPSGSLGFAGIGSQREILLTPAPKETGTATVTLSGTTSEGATGETSIAVSVADPPTISGIPSPIGASENSTYGPLDFTVSGTPPLTVTATSDNPSVVAQSGIVIGGSGTNRTLTVTPVANAIGSAQITITVTDGNGLSTSEIISFEALSTGSSGALGPLSLLLLTVGALVVASRRRRPTRR
jgi:YVTN family beta-propeller protein